VSFTYIVIVNSMKLSSLSLISDLPLIMRKAVRKNILQSTLSK
jgi:hypothetical protein